MPTAKVLLVDDNESLRLSLSKVLQHHGLELTIGGNVPEALNL